MKYTNVYNKLYKRAGSLESFKRFTGREQATDTGVQGSNARPYDTLEDFKAAGFTEPGRFDSRMAARGSAPYYEYEGTRKSGQMPYSYTRSAPVSETGDAWTYTTDSLGRPIKFTVYPESLPAHRYGEALLKAVNDPTTGHEYEIPENQPLTARQLMAYQAGDDTYVDKLLSHYNSVKPEYWNKANLRLSSPDEVKAWQDSVPETSKPDVPAFGLGGRIMPASSDFLNDMYDYYVNNAGKELFAKLSEGDNSGSYYSRVATAADSFLHEFNHLNSLGTLEHAEDYSKSPKPVSFDEGGKATLMRPEVYKGLYLTPKQRDWLKKYNIEPYAVDEFEMNQALLSFNAGRYRLQKDMQENPNNPNYKQIDPNVRKQFAAFRNSYSQVKRAQNSWMILCPSMRRIHSSSL